MKSVQILSALSLLSSLAFAAPADDKWGNDKWGNDKWGNDKWGNDKWDDDKWDGDTWDDDKWGKWGGKYKFTSTYEVVATPNQVINMTEDGRYVRTGGLPGAIGYYDFGINSDKDIICFDITLYGFRGQYESAADTATHIHEAPRGKTGPPRIAFPNPKRTGKKDERRSKGCLQAPFETGIIDEATGLDAGFGFSVAEIEANARGFFCDVHSSLAVPGAVRGQLS